MDEPHQRTLWWLVSQSGGLNQRIITNVGSYVHPWFEMQPPPAPTTTKSHRGPRPQRKAGPAWPHSGGRTPDRAPPHPSLLLPASGSWLAHPILVSQDSRVYVERGMGVRGTATTSTRPRQLRPQDKGNFLLSVFIFHILDFESQAGVDIYLGQASPSPWASLV